MSSKTPIAVDQGLPASGKELAVWTKCQMLDQAVVLRFYSKKVQTYCLFVCM